MNQGLKQTTEALGLGKHYLHHPQRTCSGHFNKHLAIPFAEDGFMIPAARPP